MAIKLCQIFSMVPQMCGIVLKMCGMVPKMCSMVPKMCGMVPKMCGMVSKMCGMVPQSPNLLISQSPNLPISQSPIQWNTIKALERPTDGPTDTGLVSRLISPHPQQQEKGWLMVMADPSDLGYGKKGLHNRVFCLISNRI